MSTIKLGVFYQSGYRTEACYYALKQFRKYHPDSPIALWEDNTDNLKPVADKFNCVYNKTTITGRNDCFSGRPAFNLKTTLAWADRVYQSCMTTLKDIDWVLHMEDDVWTNRTVKYEPEYQLSGISGLGHNEPLYEFLKKHNNVEDDSRRMWNKDGALGTVAGCGGSVFNKNSFIVAYKYLMATIDWNELLEVDTKVTEWTDSFLSFIFQYGGFSVGCWKDASQFYVEDMSVTGGRESDSKRLYTVEEMSEKLKEKDVTFVHCVKPYYLPTKEETEQMKRELYEN